VLAGRSAMPSGALFHLAHTQIEIVRPSFLVATFIGENLEALKGPLAGTRAIGSTLYTRPWLIVLRLE
jgi:hypothetical protein